jgi:hypothetical protein
MKIFRIFRPKFFLIFNLNMWVKTKKLRIFFFIDAYIFSDRRLKNIYNVNFSSFVDFSTVEIL